MMSYQICFRCGRRLPFGSLKYVINISISADFDGILLEPDGDINDEYERLLSEIEDLDEEALERDVYQDFDFILCNSCKDQWTREILETGGSRTPFNNDFSHFIH